MVEDRGKMMSKLEAKTKAPTRKCLFRHLHEEAHLIIQIASLVSNSQLLRD